MQGIKVRKFTDEITSCDRCGKQNLKGTFIVENTETGEVFHLGRVCVGKKYEMKSKELRTFLSDQSKQRDKERQALRQEIRNEWKKSVTYQFAQAAEKVLKGIACDMDEHRVGTEKWEALHDKYNTANSYGGFFHQVRRAEYIMEKDFEEGYIGA